MRSHIAHQKISSTHAHRTHSFKSLSARTSARTSHVRKCDFTHMCAATQHLYISFSFGCVLCFSKSRYELNPDVGLRRTCAYYRTSARAMCVRKCVRKAILKCACEVRACGHFSGCDVRLHFLPWLICWQTILCIRSM